MLGWYHTFGSVAFALGKLAALLRRFDEAQAHFEAALAANRRIRAALWVAHTQCELASMLLARSEGDDRERAHELIATARQTAEALGLVRLKKKLDRVSAEEAAKGAEATGGADAVAAALSQEAGALDMVAQSAIPEAGELRAFASFDGTVTMLFSDIEGSTALYESLGDLRAHEVIRAHNDIIRREVAAHRGHEVKTLGDSFMIAFSSARRAALCAIAAQRSFAAYCESHPDTPLRVRMGLHVGEAINDTSDFFGKAVILASRIASVANGGQIFVSSTLYDLIKNAGDLRFAPVGEKPLKGFAGTHMIYEVLW